MAQQKTRRAAQKRSPGRTKFTFDADALAKKRRESQVTIGGQKFHPAPHTVEALKEWIESLPEPDDSEDGEDRVRTRDELVDDLGLLNEQVQILLRDEAGNKPDIEFLNASLETDEANELLSLLAPSAGAVEEARGNSDRAGG